MKRLGERAATIGGPVACHLLDTIGAQAAGWRGALVTGSFNVILPTPEAPVPDLTASDLADLADQIVQHWRAP